MKKAILFTALLLASPAIAAPISYQLDPTHTQVLASWSHLGFSNPSLSVPVQGGTLVYDQKAPQKASVTVTLDMEKLNSFVPALDEHLKSGDFFDTKKYPSAVFKSTSVHPMKDGNMHISGNLTMRGVTRPVTLLAQFNKADVHPMSKKQAIGFNATTVIKRSDFGMTGFAPAISDDVRLTITVEAQGK